jgi:hypothetical protein
MRPATPSGAGDVTFLFRWNGHYWGFVAGGQVYDRYGRHTAWLEPSASGIDVYHVSGRFLGEVCEEHYVVRRIFRAEPVPRNARPPAHRRAVPDAPPDREPRDPRDDTRDGLPWPLPPPPPPRL